MVTGLTVGTTYTLTFYQGASQWDGFSGDTTNQWACGAGRRSPATRALRRFKQRPVDTEQQLWH